jgi:hypothetical protein
MKKLQLKLLVLRTPRLNALRKFYRMIGIDFTEEQHGTGPTHLTGPLGDAILELYPFTDDNAVADTTTRLGITVPNLVESVVALETLGTPIVSRPRQTRWGWRAIVRDPDGRVIELYQREETPENDGQDVKKADQARR